jgi:SAM-dependent methyltransferase
MVSDIFENQKVLVAFCSPHRKIVLANGREIVDTVTVQWMRHKHGMTTGTNCNFIEWFCEARELVARRSLSHQPRPEFVFFLDDDVLVPAEGFQKLLYRARCYPDHDIFAGVYACKGLAEPLVYAGEGVGPFWDWAIGDILTTDGHGITGCHSGLTLIRTSVFQRLIDAGICDAEADGDRPFYKTVHEQWTAKNGSPMSRRGTEDLYFAHLVKKLGGKFLIDTSILAGHIDKTTGITWGLPEDSPPVTRAKWLKDKEGKSPDREEPTKLALDLGAGGQRREWPGHRTYTTDLRADSGADYVQDTRWLNLPGDHFDLVASSHHLEHLGRWDQEKAWAEIFRVTKPGGRVEHVVPSLEWVAAKVADGQCDSHCLDVLYGAQEAHGYGRELNTHYFGYTRDIGRALAEQAGLVDVQVRDWRDDENVVYELTITGRKPAEGEESAVVAPVVAAEVNGHAGHKRKRARKKKAGV